MPRIASSIFRLLARPPRLPVAAAFSRSALPPVASPSLVHSITSLRFPSFSLPQSLPPTLSPVLGSLIQARYAQRGSEYQPSQRKRKRKHGFLARKRRLGGEKVLLRRMAKSRKYLSH